MELVMMLFNNTAQDERLNRMFNVVLKPLF